MIFDDTGRATRKEIQAEIETRMRLLKMRERMLRKQKEQIVFCSEWRDLFPLTLEMKRAIHKASHDSDGRELYVPYHAILSHSQTKGRLLYVLNVSVQRDDWKWNREMLKQTMDIPSDLIYLDREGLHEKGNALLTGIASKALEPRFWRDIEGEFEVLDGPFYKFQQWLRRFRRVCFGKKVHAE